MARRKYTPEYKQEAVLLAQQSEMSIAQVARNLGINHNLLRRWIKETTDPSLNRHNVRYSPHPASFAPPAQTNQHQ